jgi:hypothetical protein
MARGALDGAPGFAGRQDGERVDRGELEGVPMGAPQDRLALEDRGEPRDGALVAETPEDLDQRATELGAAPAHVALEDVEQRRDGVDSVVVRDRLRGRDRDLVELIGERLGERLVGRFAGQEAEGADRLDLAAQACRARGLREDGEQRRTLEGTGEPQADARPVVVRAGDALQERRDRGLAARQHERMERGRDERIGQGTDPVDHEGHRSLSPLEQELCGPHAGLVARDGAVDQILEALSDGKLCEAGRSDARLGFGAAAASDGVVGEDLEGPVGLLAQSILPELTYPEDDFGGALGIRRVVGRVVELDEPGAQSLAAGIGGTGGGGAVVGAGARWEGRDRCGGGFGLGGRRGDDERRRHAERRPRRGRAERAGQRVRELVEVVESEAAAVPRRQRAQEGPDIAVCVGRSDQQLEESLQRIRGQLGIEAEALDRVLHEGAAQVREPAPRVEALGQRVHGEGLAPDAQLEGTCPGDVGGDRLEGALGEGPWAGRRARRRRETAQRTRQLEQDAGRIGRAAFPTGSVRTGDGPGSRRRSLGLGIAHGLLAPIGLPAWPLKATPKRRTRIDLQAISEFRLIFAFLVDGLRGARLR